MPPRKKPRRRTLLQRLRRLILTTLLLLVVDSVGLVALLRWVDPPYSAVMLWRIASEGGPQHQTWTALDDIHPGMALAVVAAEDQRFPKHWGFDTDEILAAVQDHLDGGKLRGASTISQQVARNLFLWQGRSYVRKGLEVWFTGLIETLWPKKRVLEMYLNFAEMGERTFGVAAASQHYFGIAPSGLNDQQSALLAAVLPNPITYRVDSPSAYVRQRQAWILRQMRNLGGPNYLGPILD